MRFVSPDAKEATRRQGAGLFGHAVLPGEPELPLVKVADLIAAEHLDFVQAIQTGRSPAVSGQEARRSLALVEACYAERQLWRLPWVKVEAHQ
jgi:predicted dehydrogenase